MYPTQSTLWAFLAYAGWKAVWALKMIRVGNSKKRKDHNILNICSARQNESAAHRRGNIYCTLRYVIVMWVRLFFTEEMYQFGR